MNMFVINLNLNLNKNENKNKVISKQIKDTKCNIDKSLEAKKTNKDRFEDNKEQSIQKRYQEMKRSNRILDSLRAQSLHESYLKVRQKMRPDCKSS